MQRCHRFYWLAGVLCCGFLIFAVSPADARRVALVIGNADYKVQPLQNPVNDATAVAKALEGLKFEKVILRLNLGADEFRAALTEMSRESVGTELGLVYFAGHGTEVSGRNFLIPVDAELARADDLDPEAIGLDTVLNQLAGVANLKLVILDACRNNIFPLAGAKRSVGRGLARIELEGRGLGRGLSRIEPEGNTLVVYAAKDGTTAEDGVGRRHSPFTEALLQRIAAPLEVRLLFGQVRDDVVALTQHAAPPQQPHIYGTLGGRSHYLRAIAPAEANPEAQLLLAKEQEISKLRAEKTEAEQKLLTTDSKRGVGQFDGVWSIISKTEGCKGPGWTTDFFVANGNINGAFASGRVSADGRAAWRLANRRFGGHFNYTGTFHGSGGSGKFSLPGTPCRGEFTARRNS